MDQGEQCDGRVGAPPSRPQLGRDRVARVCLVRTFSTHSRVSAEACKLVSAPAFSSPVTRLRNDVPFASVRVIRTEGLPAIGLSTPPQSPSGCGSLDPPTPGHLVIMSAQCG